MITIPEAVTAVPVALVVLRIVGMVVCVSPHPNVELAPFQASTPPAAALVAAVGADDSRLTSCMIEKIRRLRLVCLCQMRWYGSLTRRRRTGRFLLLLVVLSPLLRVLLRWISKCVVG